MFELSSRQLGLETWMLAGGSVCPGERKESFVIESKNRKV